MLTIKKVPNEYKNLSKEEKAFLCKFEEEYVWGVFKENPLHASLEERRAIRRDKAHREEDALRRLRPMSVEMQNFHIEGLENRPEQSSVDKKQNYRGRPKATREIAVVARSRQTADLIAEYLLKLTALSLRTTEYLVLANEDHFRIFESICEGFNDIRIECVECLPSSQALPYEMRCVSMTRHEI